MTYSFKSKTLAAAVAMAMVGTSASALDVSFIQLTPASLDALTPVANPLADATTGVVLENITSSQFVGSTIISRSPWDTSTSNQGGFFTSVQNGSTATYNLGATWNKLELIWGSPDFFNELTLSLSSTGASETVTGTQVQGIVARSAVAVTITDFEFDTLTFAAVTAANAFEFANIEPSLDVTPIPLPAAGFMLLAGLGGLAMVSRRRREED